MKGYRKVEDNKRIEVLEMIAEDVKNDAKNFDGRPFNGKTVAEYLAHQGAAIAALANIIKSTLEQTTKGEKQCLLQKEL